VRFRHFMVVALSLCLGTVAYAQTPNTLSLSEALSMATKKRPEIAAVKARVDAALGRVDQARTAYFPQVDISASITHGLSGSYGKLGIAGLGASPFKLLVGGSVNAWWTVYDFGRRSGSVHEQETNVEVRKAEGAARKASVVLQVVEGYTECVWRQQKVSAMAELVAARAISHELAEARLTSELGTAVDVQLAEVKLSEANRQRDLRQSYYDRCLLRLASLLGVETSLAALTVPPEAPLPTQSPEAALAEAYKQRPELAAMRMRATRMGIAVDRINAQHYPMIRVAASGGYARLQDRFSDDTPYYAVGLAVEMPLYEGGRVLAEARTAEAEKMVILHELAELKMMIRSQVLDAHQTALAAHREQEAAEADLGRTQGLLDRARARYAAKLGNFLEVTEAELAMARVRESIVDARYVLWRALARFNYARGVSVISGVSKSKSTDR
jgi:outer membrane protein TolC